MKTTTEQNSKRTGRPPKGRGKGGEPERLADYPRLSVTIRPQWKARIEALARLEGAPTWEVVDDILRAFFESLPASEKRRIDQALKG